jgi:hypothetical protein
MKLLSIPFLNTILLEISNNLCDETKEIFDSQINELNHVKNQLDIKRIYFSKKTIFNSNASLSKEFNFSLLSQRLALFEIEVKNKKILGEAFISRGNLFYISFEENIKECDIIKIKILEVNNYSLNKKIINKKQINSLFQDKCTEIDNLSNEQARIQCEEILNQKIIINKESNFSIKNLSFNLFPINKTLINKEIDKLEKYSILSTFPYIIFNQANSDEVYQYAVSMGRNLENYNPEGYETIYNSIYHYILFIYFANKLTPQ